jgi:predicted N-acetyltransferase YhbS
VSDAAAEPLERLDLAAVSRLCGRAVADPPSVDELEDALCAPDQPTTVFGDPALGMVALVACDDGAHVRLLAVDPAARRRGLGHALMKAAEDWATAQGHPRLITGADPPYFLWPGVPSTETGLLCLFERRHYSRAETNFNMDVDLQQIPDDPGGHQLAGPEERDELDEWLAAHWSNWRPEVLRALDKGNLVIAREQGDKGTVTAFCAFEVNRRGLLGPVAVRPDLMGRGRGKGVLLGALYELRRRGADRVSVVWIGPVPPYAAVGGTVSDVFFVYRKELR